MHYLKFENLNQDSAHREGQTTDPSLLALHRRAQDRNLGQTLLRLARLAVTNDIAERTDRVANGIDDALSENGTYLLETRIKAVHIDNPLPAIERSQGTGFGYGKDAVLSKIGRDKVSTKESRTEVIR